MSDLSTISCSTTSSVEIEEKRSVRIYPMVQVKQIPKYSEEEVSDLFLSRDELHMIREREKVCLMYHTSNTAMKKCFTTAFSLADREDLECTTGLRSFDEMQARHYTRKVAVQGVLREQAFNREKLGIWDTALSPKQHDCSAVSVGLDCRKFIIIVVVV